MVFDSLGMVSYSHSIVTISLFFIFSKIKRYIGRKKIIPPAFDSPIRQRYGNIPTGTPLKTREVPVMTFGMKNCSGVAT